MPAWLFVRKKIHYKVTEEVGDKFVECGAHGNSRPAFLCWHLLHEENAGWNEHEESPGSDQGDFAGCIKAHCDDCESIAQLTTGFVEQAFANIQLVCEKCALRIKRANLK